MWVHTAAVNGSLALESSLTRCGSKASLLLGLWNLPGPGIEPMCPALAGGFLSPEPLSKVHRDFCLMFPFSGFMFYI